MFFQRYKKVVFTINYRDFFCLNEDIEKHFKTNPKIMLENDFKFFTKKHLIFY